MCLSTYPQVVIEGVAGATFASSIVVDDVTFCTNLTCFSVGKPTPSETFEGNCFPYKKITRETVHLHSVILYTRCNPDSTNTK